MALVARPDVGKEGGLTPKLIAPQSRSRRAGWRARNARQGKLIDQFGVLLLHVMAAAKTKRFCHFSEILWEVWEVCRVWTSSFPFFVTLTIRARSAVETRQTRHTRQSHAPPTR